MNTIAILPEGDDAHPATFRAITTDRKATGRTPGEALDALTSQLGAEEAGAAVILQLFRPDKHFSAEQRDRLSTLMERWRAARETGSTLPPAEQTELERLVDEELQGSAERAAQMSRELEVPQRLRSRLPDEKRVGLQTILERHAWQVFMIRLLMLWFLMIGTILTSVALLDVRLIFAIVVATGVIHLLVFIAFLLSLWSSSRLLRRIDPKAPHDLPEGSADSSNQRERAGAR